MFTQPPLAYRFFFPMFVFIYCFVSPFPPTPRCVPIGTHTEYLSSCTFTQLEANIQHSQLTYPVLSAVFVVLLKLRMTTLSAMGV